MPPDLVKAHRELDRAVDLCYRPQPFPNETRRIEYLFDLYDRYTAGLFVPKRNGMYNVKIRAGQFSIAKLTPRSLHIFFAMNFFTSPCFGIVEIALFSGLKKMLWLAPSRKSEQP